MTSPKNTKSAEDTPSVDTSADPPPSRETIAVAAYYRAEKRGFAPGGELDDWLEAELELMQKFTQE
jgi:hypothetical protein